LRYTRTLLRGRAPVSGRPRPHPPAPPALEQRRSALPEKTEDPASAAARHEKWKEKGVALRAFFYIFGTHVFAGFVWLLFYLGEHAEK
jgi:hypothetical protein